VQELRRFIGAVLASKYRVDSVLGAGGMGVVFAAMHLQLKEQVAIKLLRAETSTRADAVERFLREARVATRLRGEHVVRVLDVGTLDGGAPFIAMEYLRGSDLGAVVRTEGHLPAAVAVDYVLQACEAIAEAHSLGVIHRDLKPANLFLTKRVDGSPCVKVLDFGISKIDAPFPEQNDPLATTGRDPDGPDSSASWPRLGRPPSGPGGTLRDRWLASDLGHRPGVTKTSALLGSPRYMSPEQLRSPRDVDVRADVWALGAILFELLTGRPPFEGDTLDELRAATAGPVPKLPGIPAGLERAVHACLAREPEQRCQTVTDLADALAPYASPDGAESAKRVRRRIARASGLTPSAPTTTLAAAAHEVPGAQPRTGDAAVRSVVLTARRAALGLAAAAAGVVATLALGRGAGIPRASSVGASVGASAGSSAPAAPSGGSGEISSDGQGAELVVQPPARATTSCAPAPPTTSAASASRQTLFVVVPRAPRAVPAAPTPTASSDPLKLDAGFLFSGRK
jgi:serine/threonine-protein kinase